MAMEISEGEFCSHFARIKLDCGRVVEFSMDSVREDAREWLGKVIADQVNEIVAREVHAAVEGHKAAFNNLLKPAQLILPKR